MPLSDPGLQPERTELAWRRTALALAVGALVAMRMLPDALGSLWWAVPGGLGLIAAGVLWLLARRRYLRFGGPAGGGTLVAVTAAFVGAGALAAVVLVLVSALSA